METRSLGERVTKAKREVRSRSHDGIERRTVRAIVEMRENAEGHAEFSGHAAVFNDLSEDLGYFDSWYERIEPGAFAMVLRKSPDVRALFNHDPNLVLARSTVNADVGWLKMDEDDTGLSYRFVPTATTYAADLEANVRAGVVDQSSFAFRVARQGDSWEEDDEGRLVRTIHQFGELFDVSPVTYPAYPTTDVGLSSRDFDADEGEPESREEPAPTVQREDDEPAEAARLDEHGEDQQAGEPTARTERAERLRLRIGEPRL